MPAIEENVVPSVRVTAAPRRGEGLAFYLVTGALAALTLILAGVAVASVVAVLGGGS